MTFASEDLIEMCLAEIEELILARGWNDYSYTASAKTGPIDLERAIENVAGDNYHLAIDAGYEDLNTKKALMAELKAYISLFTPPVGTSRVRSSLSGFNNSTKTLLSDICEVLQLARESFERGSTGYRFRHSLAASHTMINLEVC